MTRKSAHVLIIDDDVAFCDLVVEYVRSEGNLDVSCVHDGQLGVRSAISGKFDVVVLDVGLPRLNGFEVLKKIRDSSDVPVLMLTARGDDIDRILGLEIGADDYVPKPCNLRELVARLRAILRRGRLRGGPVEDSRLTVGDVTIERGTQSVYRNGTIVQLTGAEFSILSVLCEAAGEVVDKSHIARQGLGRRIMPYDRSVDVHVGNLRRKLGPLADGRQRIKTVRGRGYLYVDLK
ncbi:MAG: response regulator transcription factor [Pseudomonadota bacterium]